MYNKDNFDHIFYRIKKSIPSSYNLYLLIAILKVYPLLLLTHTGGYTNPPEKFIKIHTYFRYFSITFYLNNSLSGSNILLVIGIILIINLILILLLVYYLSISKSVKKIDENYGDISSLGYTFNIFSHFVFFKYIVLFQFFNEINLFPLVCLNNVIDYDSITNNKIFGSKNIKNTVDHLCGGNKISFIGISVINLLIDVGFYWLLTSRFFDFNVLSDYNWNFYPNFIFSFEFMESFSQCFYILFLFYKNKTFQLSLDIFVLVIFALNIYQMIAKNLFYTANTEKFINIAKFSRIISYLSAGFIAIFTFGSNSYPNDINIIVLVIIECLISLAFIIFSHSWDDDYIKNILVNPLQNLNDKNIYQTLIFLIKEFNSFQDINQKFDDNNLDLFLNNYVNHLKICEDMHCPCKNYVKKVTGASNTIKSGYTTVINFTHMKKDQQEEYILNKFFNVLAANINTTIKYTNNVNLNNIKDSQRQKLIYQLRMKLITAVKKLISYKLEKLTYQIENTLSQNFSKTTKDFIRINFYSVNILCNHAYYKTQFLYFEFLSDFFKKNERIYHFNLIYYLYLKMFSINEYNTHMSQNRSVKKEHTGNGIHLDFRTVLSLCVKYYEIEDKLIQTAINYNDFILYFTRDKIFFNELLKIMRKFKSNYKGVTRYISHYFKNDKINNLFVCTKLILFFKILHFDIPETLHNKLIIQIHDTDDNNKTHSYIDSNYYMIINYLNGDFVIKFISHELLIVLEYSEEELKEKDFHILMPDKLRRLHKHMIINEVKGKNSTSGAKEIFFVAKKQNCVLFDIQYKFLLNLRGEITILTVVNLKKPNKDFRMCFCCLEDHGDVLAMNKEYEDYFILSMKLLEYVKIDTEKLILQNMGERIRNFFKDEENTDFQEQFDYELFLQSLFDEEFEVLKEKNELLYRRKYARWEVLKEMNRKGRYYTRYIELNIKQRVLGKKKIYFLKYSVKITLSLRSIEPHSTTLSLIHAVKISKREMAKLSFYKGEEIYESKTEKGQPEIPLNESHDDLFESQSQISSAVSQLKERNSVRLFKQKKNTFQFLPKSKNILILMISIGIISVVNVIYNIISLVIKKNYYKKLEKFLVVDADSIVLKNNIFLLTEGMLTLSFIEDGIIDSKSTSSTLSECLNLINTETDIMDQVTYNISYINAKYFEKNIDNALVSTTNDLSYVFNGGYIYKKTDTIYYQELTRIKKLSLDMTNKYSMEQNISLPIKEKKNSNIYNYFLLDKLFKIQHNISSYDILLNDQDIALFFLINNIFPEFDDYSNSLMKLFGKQVKSAQNSTMRNIIFMKILEFIIICLIIAIEWVFIFLGHEKSKKKMVVLRQKIEVNNIEMTLQKIDEFIHFSNNFNIGSLYYIADLDLKRVENTEINNITTIGTSSIGMGTFLSQTNNVKKTNLTENGNESSFNNNIRDGIKGMNSQKSTNLIFNNNSDNRVTPGNTPLGNSTPGNEPDGKKNLLKVMHKLEQIKGIKKTKDVNGNNNNISNNISNNNSGNALLVLPNYEKKPTKDSKISNESSQLFNNENMGENIAFGKNDNEEKKNMENSQNNNYYNNNLNQDQVKSCFSNKNKQNNNNINSNSNNDKDNSEIKPVLRGKEGNIRMKEEIKIKSNEGNEISLNEKIEDSKINILKNDEGIGLIQPTGQKKNRVTKVQFKEKNVRYYSPGQNVNETVDENFKNSQNKNIDDSENGKDLTEYKTSLNNPNNKKKVKYNSDKGRGPSSISLAMSGIGKINNRPLLNEIKSNNNSIKNITPSQMNSSNVSKKNLISSDKNLTPIGKEIKEKSSYNDINKFQLIDQGKAVTVKKSLKTDQKNINAKEEIIEYKIDNIIHNNFQVKVILHITLGIFIILYVISLIMNFIFNKNIENAKLYTVLLYNKTTLLMGNILNYQFHVIRDYHDQEDDEHNIKLEDGIMKYEENRRLLTHFETEKNPSILEQTYEFEKNLRDNNFCDYFSQRYYNEFKENNIDKEREECLIVGEQMNINGLANAESYVLSTLIVLIEDWNNLYKAKKDLTEDEVVEHLKFDKFYAITLEMVYTFRKYTRLLNVFIMDDIGKIFNKITFVENIFGLCGIILNIVFLVLSLLFIIYPIKSVELLISWVSHKIMQN